MRRAIKHNYGSTQIIDLNMADLGGHRNMRLSNGVILTLCAPVVALGIMTAAMIIPEIGFIADCMNIPGGDFCTISIK